MRRAFNMPHNLVETRGRVPFATSRPNATFDFSCFDPGLSMVDLRSVGNEFLILSACSLYKMKGGPDEGAFN